MAVTGKPIIERDALRARVAELEAMQPCGHPMALKINSVESDYTFCELCEARHMQRDAETAEAAHLKERDALRACVAELEEECSRLAAALAPKPDPAIAASHWRHSVEREETMQRWDSWRRYIASGGGGSWPRDAFECELDAMDEDQEALRARVAELEAALTVLYEEADGFSVSGVYFNEPCMGHKGLEMARAALAQEPKP